MSGDNSKRAFGEVVSLDAWHQPFSKSDKKVDVHVDVAFLTARLGGEAEAEVRFVLQLRQADIVIVVPPGEPAKVDPKSVSRDAPQVSAKLTQDKKLKKNAKAQVASKAKIGASSLSGGGALALAAGFDATDEMRVALVEAVKNMRVLHSLGPDGHRWTVSTIDGNDQLAGRPWDAASAPRLAVIDTRVDRTKLPPVVRVEVRCRREDLHITDIELKDIKGVGDLIKRGGRRNKEAAAEAIIRSRLSEEGLLGGDIEDRYAMITLASIYAQGD